MRLWSFDRAVTSSSTALFRWPEIHQTHSADIEQKLWGLWIEYPVSIEHRIRRSIEFCSVIVDNFGTNDSRLQRLRKLPATLSPTPNKVSPNRQQHKPREWPDQFALIVVYRGLHCPICSNYLADLSRKLDDFDSRGVKVLVVSSDAEERAVQAEEKWGLTHLTVARASPV